MRALGWILGAVVVLAALLALTGTQVRLRHPAVMAVDCCDNRCTAPSWCASDCTCHAGALRRDASVPSPPHSAIYQADWISPAWPPPIKRSCVVP